MQVNVTTKVNNKTIRREKHNDRDHWIVPSYTLPANVVMNEGLYTSEQIDKHFQGIEGTLAPLGHPVLNGAFISASSAEGINQGHVGAWNRNVKKAGNRIYVEKWIDVEVANQSEKGRELIERIESIERGDDVPPIHTSIAVFLEQLEPNEEQSKGGAKWVADIVSVDHDAILLHETGAATPEQGVGMMVNADAAEPLKEKKGVISKIKSIFKPQDNLANNQEGGDMPLSKEEKAELVELIGEGLSANIDKAVKPLSDKVDALQANQQVQLDAINANRVAEESVKREAISKDFGEVIANSLQGEALEEMFKKCGTATALGTNSATTIEPVGAPSAEEYFK